MSFLKNIFILIKETILKISKQKNSSEIENINQKITYEELYSKIETGSIVWAKRYKNEEEQKNIPEGHDEGPFLVLKKEKGKIYCFYGTGTFLETDFYIRLNNVEYDYLTKETYFNLYKLRVIDKFSLIKNLGRLNENDENNLYDKLKCFQKNFYNEEGKRIYIDMPRQCGDIIVFNNKKYIVLDIVNKKLLCIPIKDINESASNLDYSKILELKDTDDIIVKGTLSNKKLISTLKNYKKYIKYQENFNKTQRGSVIYKDNKYYYIYGEEGEYFLGFEIFKLYINKSDILNLNNTIYYTFYNDLRISKKEKHDNIYLCVDKEMTLVKEKRKNYKLKTSKSNKSNNIQQSSNEILLDSIIKLNEFSEETFLVENMIGSILVCVAETEKNIHNPKKHYFNKSDVVLVKTINKKR